MELILRNISKRYGRETIFQNVNTILPSGSRTAILGPNGSGKSTLLQLLGGAITPTTGSIVFRSEGREITDDDVYRHVAFATPYMGLYEDLSLAQTISFHTRFKPLRYAITEAEVARIAFLEHALEKSVLHFSSGMKQRLKLSLAILSDTPLLLLDEPASNLDANSTAWFRELLASHISGRTLLIASNRQAVEHDLCDSVIEMEALKD